MLVSSGIKSHRITAVLTLNRGWDKYAHIIQFKEYKEEQCKQPGGNMQHRQSGLWCWRRYHTGKFPFSVRNLITPPTVKDGLALDRNGVTINHLASRIDFSQPAEGQNLRPIRSGQWRCYATNISMKFLFYSSIALPTCFFPTYQHIKTDLQFSVQRERLRLMLVVIWKPIKLNFHSGSGNYYCILFMGFLALKLHLAHILSINQLDFFCLDRTLVVISWVERSL